MIQYLIDELKKKSNDDDVISIKDEIRDMRNVLLKEIQNVAGCLNSQTSSSVTDPTETTEPDRRYENTNMSQLATTSGAAEHSYDSRECQSTTSQQHEMPKVLILGDSVTKVLSTTKLSQSKLDLAIRSQAGARIKTVESYVQSQKMNITNLDAVILHVGINNISEAELPETIVDHFRDITDTIKNKNSNAKILISAILPKRRDNLSLERITATNTSLEDFCKDEGYVFIDHTKSFKEKTFLYRDEIHLNSRGGAVLGTNIRNAVFDAFNIKTQDQSSTGKHKGVQNFHQAQYPGRGHNWRTQNRSPWTRNPSLQEIMTFPPPQFQMFPPARY